MENEVTNESARIEQVERDSFIQGVAYCVGWLIMAHDQPCMAIDMLRHSGFGYDDLVKARCASYDLKPIAKELGLRLDGTKRKAKP